MRPLHPASLILFGLAFLIAGSTRGGIWLGVIALGSAGFALSRARRHFLIILRRSRWLLLTMLVLFGWMTPGTPIPVLPMATQEGLGLAAEHIARLLLAIATVAVLLSCLSTVELVSGLRTLLAPLAPLRGFRDRLAVRLMLTLEEVENVRRGDEALGMTVARLTLPMTSRGGVDYLAALGSAALLLIAALA